jgi:hypothetical protein
MDARYKIAEAMMRGVGQPMAAFPDQRQDADMALRGMASDLYQADQRRAQDYRAGISDALMQSWPAELAKSAYGAVTLPGDVYAGKVNPMSDEAVGRAAEFAGLMTLGAGGIPAGKNEMRMGIKAYHGSPHDFDRFDMSKIGTGEGAQAYGHGLYFAGNEGVAKGYRDTLSRGIDGSGVTVRIDGNPIKEPTVDQIRAARFGIESTASGIQKQIDATRQKLNSASKIDELGMGFSDRDLVQMQIDEYTKRLNDVMGLSGRVEMGPAGRMYEVNLNTTPDRLLDWDAPLSAQPQKARELLESLGVTSTAGNGANWLRDAANKVAEKDGSWALAANKANVTPKLKEVGIDGIKYLDAGSRAAGDGSRNYVMFDDKLVQILRKYGVATAAALPAAALAELGMSREEAKRSF